MTVLAHGYFGRRQGQQEELRGGRRRRRPLGNPPACGGSRSVSHSSHNPMTTSSVKGPRPISTGPSLIRPTRSPWPLNPPKGPRPISTSGRRPADRLRRGVSIPRRVHVRFPRPWKTWAAAPFAVSIPRRVHVRFPRMAPESIGREHGIHLSQSPEGSTFDFHRRHHRRHPRPDRRLNPPKGPRSISTTSSAAKGTRRTTTSQSPEGSTFDFHSQIGVKGPGVYVTKSQSPEGSTFDFHEMLVLMACLKIHTKSQSPEGSTFDFHHLDRWNAGSAHYAGLNPPKGPRSISTSRCSPRCVRKPTCLNPPKGPRSIST